MIRSTRERIVEESLRLFAERGYAATSVAEIESASGLSPGAGGLYRHFRSKYEVLAAAVNEHAARTRARLSATLLDTRATASAEPSAGTPAGVEERLAALCRAGLAKVAEESRLTRVFFRDLGQFPELMAVVRDGLFQPMFDALRAWFQAQPEYAGVRADWPSVCAVLGGAVVHFRLLHDTMAEPAVGAERDRFVATWVRLALGLLPPTGGHPPAQTAG